MSARDFLLELGTEELPPKSLAELEQALREGMRMRLERAGLKHGELESFATPRRLALRVRRLTLQQPSQSIKRRGPPLSIAFDAEGRPGRAAQAFADSCGVAIEALGREQDAKGVQYLSFSGTKPGQAAAELLPAMVQEALEALPVGKRMRWGSGEAQFVRPVHWLLLLLGSEALRARILDTPAGNLSYGHRFLAPKALRISSPASYAGQLLRRGKVIAGFGARREHIRAAVTASAAAAGGRALMPAALLDEVTALVEWPVAITGQFEARFLALPREVLIAALQEHQRYFALEGADGRLLPSFIAISNIDSLQPQVVRAGNERVVRPRLADATFFWEQDRKQSLAARVSDLNAVTYQAQLGSIGARALRITLLARTFAREFGADPQLTARAGELCKCDLLTAMVGEFPELQGIMGDYYARADGEPDEVASAIREHYLPRGAGDSLPQSASGRALAIADKLDTLAGIFAIGQKPTGTRDPFGLRRAAIGLLRIALDQRMRFDLNALIHLAVSSQPLADIQARTAELTRQIAEFVLERLRAQYLEGDDVTTEMFEAVLQARPASIVDFDERVRALVGFVSRSEGRSLAAANKRIANILKKSDADARAAGGIDAALQSPPERALHAALEQRRSAVEAALTRGDYAAALDTLSQLREPVDAFFDQVLVNDPDARLRANRLALLTELHGLFRRIADLSQLPG